MEWVQTYILANFFDRTVKRIAQKLIGLNIRPVFPKGSENDNPKPK